MKPLYCVILIFATTFVCTDLSAQERFGRGRFLKRLRDDLSSAQQRQQADRERQLQLKRQEQQRKLQQQKSRTPTPAGARKPTPANGSAKAKAPAQPQYTNGRKPKFAPQAGPLKSAKSKDFGMSIVQNKQDDFIVTQVLPNGNAAKAGIRRGDVIVELGGLSFKTLKKWTRSQRSSTMVIKWSSQLKLEMRSQEGFSSMGRGSSCR